jgi:hypothetical protein
VIDYIILTVTNSSHVRMGLDDQIVGCQVVPESVQVLPRDGRCYSTDIVVNEINVNNEVI